MTLAQLFARDVEQADAVPDAAEPTCDGPCPMVFLSGQPTRYKCKLCGFVKVYPGGLSLIVIADSGGFTFSDGVVITANNGILGLSNSLTAYEGYDGCVNEEKLSAAHRKVLAEHMKGLWDLWANAIDGFCEGQRVRMRSSYETEVPGVDLRQVWAGDLAVITAVHTSTAEARIRTDAGVKITVPLCLLERVE